MHDFSSKLGLKHFRNHTVNLYTKIVQSHTSDQVLGFDVYLQPHAVLHLSYGLRGGQGWGGGGRKYGKDKKVAHGDRPCSLSGVCFPISSLIHCLF